MIFAQIGDANIAQLLGRAIGNRAIFRKGQSISVLAIAVFL